MKLRQFGETIPDLQIHNRPAPYPVLDERDVRAAAGIMLIFGIISFTNALLLQNFIPLSIFVIVFAVEFSIRIFLNPYLAPIFALGKFITRKQAPEWTGAAQKKFAWGLGLLMAGAMIIIVPILHITGTLPFTLCIICLTLLWFETSFGICIGCMMYKWLLKSKILKEPEHMPACPGGSCQIPRKKKK